MAKNPTSAEVYKALIESKSGNVVIHDGDKVKLNIKKIQSHPDYEKLNNRYKMFIQKSADRVFTVYLETGRSSIPNTVCLKEADDNWLFWIGDLIKVR